MRNNCNILQDDVEKHTKHKHDEPDVHDVDDVHEHADDLGPQAKRDTAEIMKHIMGLGLRNGWSEEVSDA